MRDGSVRLLPALLMLALATSGAMAGARPSPGADTIRHEFDGASDDLLTAGLGAEGLRGPMPVFADPLRPTRTEIRRRAIWQNYRALVDLAPEGGFGERYGPVGGLRVPGVEILVPVRGDGGGVRATVMLQIPRDFDARRACLVVAASSGSRGIYGALPTAGEWGLRRGCAVAHTDKGTGTGLWDVDRGIGLRIDGTVTRDLRDPLLGFVPPDEAALRRLREREPHAVLLRHAHSGRDPEAEWGEHVVAAARTAFELLDREYASRRPRVRFTPANTLVIGVGISNGGAAILRALERDGGRLFDAAVVSEPNVNVASALPRFLVNESGARREIAPRSLYDYASLHGLLQPCAVLALEDPTAPLQMALQMQRARLEGWCGELARLGLVRGAGVAEQSRDARERLLEAGVLPAGLRLGAVNVQFELWLAVLATYASAYGRAPVDAMPCGFGFAAVDAAGAPRALTDIELAAAFSDGAGLPGTAGVALLRRDEAGRRSFATARGFEAVRCLDALRPGLAAGVRATEARGRPGARPVVVLHGRADSLIPVNFSARPWYVATLGGAPARATQDIRYYEIAGGQHFDVFLALPGMRAAYVAMQPRLVEALDLVHARLTRGAPLPPSQVVREAIRPEPGAAAIAWREGVLEVPE